MKTSELTADEFASTFGAQYIVPGPFTYFACDNGLGIIRDNLHRSIEIVSRGAPVAELSQEDELLLMTLVCGEFQDTTTVPVMDSLFDYEERAHQSALRLKLTQLAIGLLLAICMASILLLIYLFIS